MTRWMVPRAAALAAAALLCASLLTAWLVPLFDPDEGYYPATAAESADTGRSWDLQFNGEPRWDKPVLSYALIQSAFSMLGRSDGAARVPSALEGAALVLVIGALAGALAGARAGGLSAVVLSTTVGVQVFSRVAHPEIGLVLSIGTTQLLLACWLILPDAERPRWLPVLIGAAMGYGMLSKGPVAVAVPAVGALVAAPFLIDLRARWRAAIRDALVAGAVTIVVAAPWYVAMAMRHGSEFLRDALWDQNVGRYTGQLAVHASGSPFFYVLPAMVAMLPWTALLPWALVRVRRPRADDPRGALRLCIALMAAATFAFYSLSASKLASYILALTPSASVLVGLYLDEDLSTAAARHAPPYRATSLVLVVTAVVLVVVALANEDIASARGLTGGVPGPNAGTLLFSAAVQTAAVLAAGGLLVLRLRGRARVLALSVVGACVPLVALLAARPLMEDAYPWQRFASRIAQDPGPVWVESYRVPSLTFYAGRKVARVTDARDLNGVIAGGEGWLIVSQDRLTTGPLVGRIGARRAAVVERGGSVVLVRLKSSSVAGRVPSDPPLRSFRTRRKIG